MSERYHPEKWFPMHSWPSLACSPAWCHSPTHPPASSAISVLSHRFQLSLMRLLASLTFISILFSYFRSFHWYNYSFVLFFLSSFQMMKLISLLFLVLRYFSSYVLIFFLFRYLSSFYLVWTICVAEKQGEHEQLTKNN